MNQLFISGNVTIVKEVATVKTSKVLNFSVAVNKYYTKDGGEKVSETTYVECSLWNREKLFPYIKVGTHVVIQGEASVRAYLNKDKEAGASLLCQVDSIEFQNKPESNKAEA